MSRSNLAVVTADPHDPIPLPPEVAAAIKCGHVPTLRGWREIDLEDCTLGETVCRWIETNLSIPEGPRVGKPFHLEDFQVVFILSIFDGPRRARKAFLSIGRKAGKTALAAALCVVFLLTRLGHQNGHLASGAMSRDQAGILYKYMAKMLLLSPKLQQLWWKTDTQKRMRGLKLNTEYHALSAEGKTNMGGSPFFWVGDEWGQVVGPSHPLITALETSQGAYENGLAIVISTIAANDSDWLCMEIDDAIRSQDPETVCHYYTADMDLEVDDPRAWRQANPATGAHRSEADLESQARKAKRLPSAEAGFRNLQLNQRVSAVSLWLAPSVWKENNSPPDIEVFRKQHVVMALDLSDRSDLTAAVACAIDPSDETIHLLPWVFIPREGLEQRALQAQADYVSWERSGQLVALEGKTLEYEQIASYLESQFEILGITVNLVVYDRWRINYFKKGCEGLPTWELALWKEFGQGYKDMSPALETFETEVVNGRIKHGGHPLLTMAAASAIAIRDSAGNKKLDKSKSSRRIDPLVAAVMAAHIAKTHEYLDTGSMIG
jgi:phage terminase large subunit-like protein